MTVAGRPVAELGPASPPLGQRRLLTEDIGDFQVIDDLVDTRRLSDR